jgi:hypothetical protein
VGRYTPYSLYTIHTIHPYSGAVYIEGAEGTEISGCQFKRLDGNGVMVTGAILAVAVAVAVAAVAVSVLSALSVLLGSSPQVQY